MNRFDFEDTLEPLGILAGGFVILVGLGTLMGMPWTTTEFTVAGIIQTIGTFVAIAVGVVLVLVSYTGDVRDLLPEREG